jgi:hypothetical protein
VEVAHPFFETAAIGIDVVYVEIGSFRARFAGRGQNVSRNGRLPGKGHYGGSSVAAELIGGCNNIAKGGRNAAIAGIGWPIPDGIDDAELERRLFPPVAAAAPVARAEPDWARVHAEMKLRGVTLAYLQVSSRRKRAIKKAQQANVIV